MRLPYQNKNKQKKGKCIIAFVVGCAFFSYTFCLMFYQTD